MADTLTSTLRLTEPTIGGDTGVWPTLTNSNWAYVDEAVNQVVTISLSSSTYTLTADGSNADQARYLVYNFTGSPGANCTVTLPSNEKVGWAINGTSGGFNVILTTGSGNTLTVPPGSTWVPIYCDGTNVSCPSVEFMSVLSLGDGLTASGTQLVKLGTFSELSPSSAILSVENDSGTAAQFMNNTTGGASIEVRSDNTNVALVAFISGVSQVGSISTNTATTSYNTTSDAQLKEPIGFLDGVGPIIDKLKVRWFKWKDRPQDGTHPGFFAQELAEVWPWAVTKGHGEPRMEGFKPWQADFMKLVPLLTAELQQLRKRVAELEAKIRG